MPAAPTLSIVLPVHNEAENLGALLAGIDAAVRERCEIIIVDDASSDDGAAVAAGFKRELSLREESPVAGIDVITLPAQGGQARAIMTGLRAARGATILTMDADLQYDPADIPRLLAKLAGCDMVCGVRRNRSDGTARLLCSRLANAFRNLVTGDSLHDGGCIFRVMRRPCLAAILPLDGRLQECDFFFHPLFVRKAGFRVEEVPVAHRPRGAGRTKYRLVRGRFWSGIAACFTARRLCT
jgi:glycosyltransferase involved in cell wall biosynthesis